MILFASTTAELQDAYEVLSNTAGGGEIHLVAGQLDPIEIDLSLGGDSHVLITSADPGNPVTVTQIELDMVKNVQISNLNVDSSDVDRAGWITDVTVTDCEYVEISNVVFTSDATEHYDPADPSIVLGETIGGFSGCSNIVFADNHISGYNHGLGVGTSDNVLISGNTFTQMQGDGLRMSGVQHITVEDNYFHDFYGSVNSFNHNDMIQIWSKNALEPTHDVTITGNIIDSGSGESGQSIFIRNEMYDNGVDTSYIYENITITNNLIHNSHIHGITVSHADGVLVANNTLLFNAENGGQAPQIITGNSWNVVESNNIAPEIWNSDADINSDNVYLNYDNPLADNYVGHHFVNPFAGGEATMTDMSLRPDSNLLGSGSDLLAPLAQSAEGVEAVVVSAVDDEDPQTVTFDAGFSVDESGFASGDLGYTFQWELSDGTVLDGPAITHSFAQSGPQSAYLTISQGGSIVATDLYGVDLGDRDLLVLDFDNGFVDQSNYGSDLMNNGAQLINGNMRIGDNRFFQALQGNEQIHGLGSFDLTIGMTLLDDDGGPFVRMGTTLLGEVRPDGELRLLFQTDEGSFNLSSGDTNLVVGQAYEISIVYSNSAGEMSLMIDGTEVGSVPASGFTPGDGGSLVIGSSNKVVVNADISHVELSALPAEAGAGGSGGSSGSNEVVTPPSVPVVEDDMVEEAPDPGPVAFVPRPEPGANPDPAPSGGGDPAVSVWWSSTPSDPVGQTADPAGPLASRWWTPGPAAEEDPAVQGASSGSGPVEDEGDMVSNWLSGALLWDPSQPLPETSVSGEEEVHTASAAANNEELNEELNGPQVGGTSGDITSDDVSIPLIELLSRGAPEPSDTYEDKDEEGEESGGFFHALIGA